MRKIVLLLAIYACFFSSYSFGMIKGLINYFDKNYIDPINYVIDGKSPQLCDAIALLNPNNPSGKNAVFDQNILDNFHQAFEREKKFLIILKNAIIDSDSHSPLENLVKNARSEYYSPNTEALMYGYLTTKIQLSEETAEKLRNARLIEKNPFTAPSSPKVSTPLTNNASELPIQVNSYEISQTALEELILKGNSTIPQKMVNWTRKAVTKRVNYLTNSKAKTIAETVLYFHPHHASKKSFNRTLPLHQSLLHQALERQNRLLTLIEDSLINGDHQTLLTLHQQAHKGYFSRNASIAVAAFLNFAEQRSRNDTRAQQTNTERSLLNNQAPPIQPLCPCIPPKALQECQICLSQLKDMKLQTSECTCNPPKPLKDCFACLSKLLQQPPQPKMPA